MRSGWEATGAGRSQLSLRRPVGCGGRRYGGRVSSEDRTTPPREYHYVLHCPCGRSLAGDTEDDIVEVSFDHLRAEHPDMAEAYEREHVLFMALRLPK